MTVSRKLPISALIVSYNEGDVLGNCLASINFCDEIVVYDLGSSDNSVDVAKKAGAKVKHHKRVPHAELIYANGLDKLKHDWVLVTDPDEEIDRKLRQEIIDGFTDLSKNTAVVRAPMQYYFKRRPLRGTIWGGVSNRQLLVHRKRAYFRPLVNTPIAIKGKFKLFWWPHREGLIHHYWLSGYREFFSKHRRYLKREARARYERGERVGYFGLSLSPWRSFYDSFISKRGYLDGVTGFLLSLLWAWYNTSALIRLKGYQLKKDV